MEDYINMNPVYYCGLQSTTCTGTEELQGSACAATGELHSQHFCLTVISDRLLAHPIAFRLQ